MDITAKRLSELLKLNDRASRCAGIKHPHTRITRHANGTWTLWCDTFTSPITSTSFDFIVRLLKERPRCYLAI